MTNLNYNGPIAHAKAITPHFLKNKGGQFVIINSISGKFADPIRSSYTGSKFGLNGFFDSFR